jgi:hypothetical protein
MQQKKLLRVQSYFQINKLWHKNKFKFIANSNSRRRRCRTKICSSVTGHNISPTLARRKSTPTGFTILFNTTTTSVTVTSHSPCARMDCRNTSALGIFIIEFTFWFNFLFVTTLATLILSWYKVVEYREYHRAESAVDAERREYDTRVYSHLWFGHNGDGTHLCSPL